MGDRVEVAPELEDQIASQAEDNGRVAIQDASTGDLQIWCQLEPGCDREVVE